MWRWSVSPEAAPDTPTYIELEYRHGDIVALDGQAMTPATVLETLAQGGRRQRHRPRRHRGNRYVGMKSRVAETPAAPSCSRRTAPSSRFTLDREVAHLKDELMPRYANMILQRLLVVAERRMLQAAIDNSQQVVNGKVHEAVQGQ